MRCFPFLIWDFLCSSLRSTAAPGRMQITQTVVHTCCMPRCGFTCCEACCACTSTFLPCLINFFSNWAADCVMPLGDMFWILAVQASCQCCRVAPLLAAAVPACTLPAVHLQLPLRNSSSRSSSAVPSQPLLHFNWFLSLLQCAGFMALAIYFDAVLPDANGVQRPPWFFLLPGYWRRGGVRPCCSIGWLGVNLASGVHREPWFCMQPGY